MAVQAWDLRNEPLEVQLKGWGHCVEEFLKSTDNLTSIVTLKKGIMFQVNNGTHFAEFKDVSRMWSGDDSFVLKVTTLPGLTQIPCPVTKIILSYFGCPKPRYVKWRWPISEWDGKTTLLEMIGPSLASSINDNIVCRVLCREGLLRVPCVGVDWQDFIRNSNYPASVGASGFVLIGSFKAVRLKGGYRLSLATLPQEGEVVRLDTMSVELVQQFTPNVYINAFLEVRVGS